MVYREHDEDEDFEQPGFGVKSSEHFLKAQKEKAKKKTDSGQQFLGVKSKLDDDDSDSGNSTGSRYKTAVKGAAGDIKDGYVFKKKLNPRYETYLEKIKEKPKHLEKPKFLSNNYFEKVGLACYQKSGSSLLRKYIENITGVITGSDSDITTELDKQLQDSGLVGESILGNKVWIAQTSFPERTGIARTTINKCILLVRNPLDSMLSHFNQLATRSIEKKLDDKEFEDLADAWDEFVRQEICIWRDFYNYWMLEPLVPTFVVRHEDLYEDPKSTLTELFKFLLNTKSTEGTLIQHLINEETKKENKQYYYQNTPGYSFDKYTDDQIDFIKSHAGLTLLRFGYVKGKYGKINQLTNTDFIDDDDVIMESEKYEVDTLVRNHTETSIKIRHYYDDLNKEQLSTVTSAKYKERVESGKLVEFELNMDSENIRTKDGHDKSAKKIIRAHKQKSKAK